LLAFALAAAAAGAGAQSLADLRNDGATPGDVTTYGMGWAQQRYSSLKQINTGNVKRLVPVWNLSLNHTANASTQPLVVDGTMYLSLHDATVAVDALTGRQKWRTPAKLPADINAYLCCGIQSRGMAMMDGVLYRTTIDAQVVALNASDGKTVWTKQAADYKDGYSMTHAPLIAGNVLITGISGGEYGTRGFLDGWDLKTGEKKWHRFTRPPSGEKDGDTWATGRYEHGGATTRSRAPTTPS
jgi:alcohol dehydrogenase (cytochrome c)